MERLDNRQTATTNLASQNVSSTSNQSAQIDLIPRFHNTMSVNWPFQQWPSAEISISQSMIQLPMPVNMGSYPLLSMNNQPISNSPTQRMQAPMPVSLDHGHLSSSNKPALNAQVAHNIHSSVSTSLSSQSTKNKRPTQIRPPPKVQTVIGNSVGLQHLPSTSKRPAPPQPPQKVKSEPFDSVRSKLRESLAASLATVSEEKKQQQVEEKNSVAEHTVGMVHGKEPVMCDSSLANDVSSGHSKNLDEIQSNSQDVTKRESGLVESQLKHSYAEYDMATDASVVKDELLQGHGLCWVSEIDAQNAEAMTNDGAKRLKVAHKEATSAEKEAMAQKVENLACQIELELFKLFGGVNKKYKEKGRSLLFNLKDRSNPELRERVLSGEIAPGRLCTMTAEELASKELSEWRQAKAEELAQMIVLPDSEVDVRRLVKKTHKGEFQVELEQPDTVSVEVGLGTSVVPQLPSKNTTEARMQPKSSVKNNNTKAPERLLSDDKVGSSEQNLSGSLDNLLQEKTDLIEELMEDDLKDPELLPPIVSLDEFMLALDSEPPFENLPVDSAHETPSSERENVDGLEIKTIPESGSSSPKADPTSDTVESKLTSSNEGLESKSDPSQVNAEMNLEQADTSLGGHSANSHSKVGVKSPKADMEVKNALTQIQSNAIASETTSANIWEGLIQLAISSLATVVGVFKSGERAPTLEWPSLIEIKGRVRLDAFERFLQDLPLSRSRAVMIAQFHWKAGTSESGCSNLQEIIDSYIADERVGFAEPVAGVELYFCPPNAKMIELVRRCLPKDESDALELASDALVGVTVWRRPHSTVSPRLPSHHKHGNTKRQFSSRKLPGISSNSTMNSAGLLPSPTPRAPAVKLPDDDIDDDVPPGFGPKDDDDLPEFNFVHSSSQKSKHVTPQPSGSDMNRTHVLPAARPVDQIRQLIHKYGQSENSKTPSSNVHAWNDDDDDDIPEWQPNCHPQAPPPPPLPPQLHPYLQQQNMQPQPFQSSHQLVQTQPHQMLPHPQAPQQQFVPLATSMQMPLQLPLQPRMGMVPGQVNVQPSWQPNPWLPNVANDANVNMAVNSVQASYYNPQQGNGQAFNLPNVGILQNGMAWRPDVSRSRGV